MNENCGIYEIRNDINGHRYIGSSVNINHRFREHKRHLKLNKHHSKYLQKAWNKYGENNFIFHTLTTCPKEFLLFGEQVCMDHFKPEYNMLPFAGSSLGHKMSDEFRLKQSIRMKKESCGESNFNKMSEKRKGKKASVETKLKMSVAQKERMNRPEEREKYRELAKLHDFRGVDQTGKKRSDETRKQMSDSHIGKLGWNKGKHLSEETRRKMSEALKNYYAQKKAEQVSNDFISM